MRIVQISDTHGRHHLLKDIPAGDVLIHCGDLSDYGTEDEVLDFLNWFIELPHPHKIFVTGNHDLCLWDAGGIEELPSNVHFLQDRGVTIDGIRFFGIAYNHPEDTIPEGTDVLVTHEPPLAILDEIDGTNWGSLPLLQRVFAVRPRYHLFGHTHGDWGMVEKEGLVFSNAALLDHRLDVVYSPRVFDICPVS